MNSLTNLGITSKKLYSFNSLSDIPQNFYGSCDLIKEYTTSFMVKFIILMVQPSNITMVINTGTYMVYFIGIMHQLLKNMALNFGSAMTKFIVPMVPPSNTLMAIKNGGSMVKNMASMTDSISNLGYTYKKFYSFNYDSPH